MSRLTITRGVPGSGKTTLARAYIAEKPDQRAGANRDLLRIMLQGGRLGTREQEEQVTLIQRASVRLLLQAGMDVVVDDTNLPSKTAREWATLAAEEGAEFVVWDLSHVPLDECIRRDGPRTGGAHVGETVIRTMYDKYIRPLNGKGFPEVLPAAPRVDAVQVAEQHAPAVRPVKGLTPAEVAVIDAATRAVDADGAAHPYLTEAVDALHEERASRVSTAAFNEAMCALGGTERPFTVYLGTGWTPTQMLFELAAADVMDARNSGVKTWATWYLTCKHFGVEPPWAEGLRSYRSFNEQVDYERARLGLADQVVPA